jgi:hypothetical protein
MSLVVRRKVEETMKLVVSARGRFIFRILVLGAFSALACGCARYNPNNFITDKAEDDKYQVAVTMPNDKPAKRAVICLDYDPVRDYEPAKFRTGEDGKVSIPHRYAEAKGWHMLWARLESEGNVYYLRMNRSDVHWPQKMKLAQVKP